MADKETLKGNCTCDSCIGGWLSPRMKERLEGQADFLHYAASQLAEDIDSDVLVEGVLSELFVGADLSLHYIPTELHVKMTPAFCQGYILVLQAILQIMLRDTDDDPTQNVPTIDAVSAYLSEIQKAATVDAEHPADKSQTETEVKADAESGNTDTANTDTDEEELGWSISTADAEFIRIYLDSGGKVEYALDAITHRAHEESPVGVDYRDDKQVREDEEEFDKETADLPRCDNDLDFKLVRSKLGLNPERMGPHWFFLTDISDDESYVEEDSDQEEAIYEGAKKGDDVKEEGKKEEEDA